jgi:anaerobic ribonucleoside-triphosphate reductase
MTQVSQGIYENKAGDLCTADGTVIVPASKRVRAEVYSRVVGYMRPVSGWNKGKRAEFADRVVFTNPVIKSPEPIEEHDS